MPVPGAASHEFRCARGVSGIAPVWGIGRAGFLLGGFTAGLKPCLSKVDEKGSSGEEPFAFLLTASPLLLTAFVAIA